MWLTGHRVQNQFGKCFDLLGGARAGEAPALHRFDKKNLFPLIFNKPNGIVHEGLAKRGNRDHGETQEGGRRPASIFRALPITIITRLS